jgi:hypothetical protein
MKAVYLGLAASAEAAPKCIAKQFGKFLRGFEAALGMRRHLNEAVRQVGFVGAEHGAGVQPPRDLGSLTVSFTSGGTDLAS